MFELGISSVYNISARPETDWEEPKMPEARELHVPDFSVLSSDILKSSKEVGYMYSGVWKVGLVLLLKRNVQWIQELRRVYRGKGKHSKCHG